MVDSLGTHWRPDTAAPAHAVTDQDGASRLSPGPPFAGRAFFISPFLRIVVYRSLRLIIFIDMKKKKQLRTKTAGIAVTPDEKLRLQAEAIAAGKTYPEYLRMKLLG